MKTKFNGMDVTVKTYGEGDPELDALVEAQTKRQLRILANDTKRQLSELTKEEEKQVDQATD